MHSVQLRHELALFFIIPFPCVTPPLMLAMGSAVFG